MAEWVGAEEFVAAWVEFVYDEGKLAWKAECGRCEWVSGEKGTKATAQVIAIKHADEVHERFGSPSPMLENGSPRPPAPIPIRTAEAPVDVPREMRHPTGAEVGWRPLEGYIATVHHMPLGDIMAAMALAGFEVRVQMREKR